MFQVKKYGKGKWKKCELKIVVFIFTNKRLFKNCILATNCVNSFLKQIVKVSISYWEKLDSFHSNLGIRLSLSYFYIHFLLRYTPLV